MSIYLSKSSIFVRIVTVITTVLLALIAVTLFSTNKHYGLIAGIILSVFIMGAVMYAFASSVEKIILEKDKIILKKVVGQIEIPISEIEDVKALNYSNLTTTYGSKGVFGFVGNTMDNAISFVKDRNKMIRIATADNMLILSVDRPGELIDEIVEEMKAQGKRA